MPGFYVSAGIAATVVLIVYAVWLKFRKGKWGCLATFAILMAPLLFLIVFAYVPVRYLEPYKGKVVDAETDEPIPDAVVLVFYRLQYWSPAGSGGVNIDLQETKTDGNGEFSIPPRWEFNFKNNSTPYGHVVAWKPGYNVDQAWWENYPNTYWYTGEKHRWTNPPYAIYELRKLQTKKERLESLHGLIGNAKDFPREKREYYTKLWAEEREYLGLSTRPSW